MWELERTPDTPLAHNAAARPKLAVVGRGRLGTALSTGLRAAGADVTGPLPRGAAPLGVDVVLLCVPDAEIAAAAALIPRGPLVGHCSGATGLDVLAPHEAFSLHPLMTVTAGADPSTWAGAGAAVDGSSSFALAAATRLARDLGLRPVRIPEADRATYHAAASIASNFLVTLEWAAERLAADAGVERELLVPLVRATVENWAALGAEQALTGPVARGDEVTVARQREQVAAHAADLLPLFDALVQATRALAEGAGPAPAPRTTALAEGAGPARAPRTTAPARSGTGTAPDTAPEAVPA